MPHVSDAPLHAWQKLTIPSCQSTEHLARTCPDAPANNSECFNCGQPGYATAVPTSDLLLLTSTSHSKAECTNPKVERAFTGECRLCHESGHRSSDCPSKPPPKCKNCLEEGWTFQTELRLVANPYARSRNQGLHEESCVRYLWSWPQVSRGRLGGASESRRSERSRWREVGKSHPPNNLVKYQLR